MKCPKCHADNPSDTLFCGKCGTKIDTAAQACFTETLATSADDLIRGTVFSDRYEIIEELGAGGMGRVYRAHDKKLNEEVALKLIKPEFASQKRVVDRFRNEIKIARKITHKNVCRMHDLHEEGKTLFLTMEYVKGEDLRSLLHRTKTLSVGTALSIARQIAEGLGEAHKLGVIHRDLKPGNVMIDKDGNAKVMDFGIARSLHGGGMTGEGALIGTPEYMSPEQVEGKPADPRADIYALGIIIFEIVTGRVPFEGETAFSIANKHKSELPPNPRTLAPNVPAGLSRLILRCLEKDKAKRYQTTEELLADLAGIEQALPTVERISPRPKTITHREVTVKIQPRKLLIPALAVSVLAAVLVFIWKPWTGRRVFAPPPTTENSIAVITFENLTGDLAYDGLVKAVPNLLITKFETMGFSDVATLERLRDLMGKKPGAPLDTNTGFAACRRGAIAAMAVGEITKAGNAFAINVKVLDVATKNTLASAASRGEGESSVLMTQIDDLAGQISQRLGLGALVSGSVRPISGLTTPSMNAYQNYLSGVEAYEKYNWDEARGYFLKAIEIDPAFAMAYRGLIQLQGFVLPKVRMEAAQKAMALADRTTPKEKLYIEATYAGVVEGDDEKRYQLLRRIVDQYPKEKEAHNGLGNLYRKRKLLDEAIREYQAALDLDPNYRSALNLMAIVYQSKGDLGKALEFAKRQVAAWPNDPNPLDTLAHTYFLMGQLDLAIENCTKALTIQPDFFFSLGSISYFNGLKENYPEAIKWANEYATGPTAALSRACGHQLKAFYEYWTGSFQKALDDAEKLRVVGEETQIPTFLAYSLKLKAEIHRSQKEFQLSRDIYNQYFDMLSRLSPEAAPEYHSERERFLGSIDIEAGKLEEARKRLVALNRLLAENKDPDQKKLLEDNLKILKGEILIADGSFAEAVPFFEGWRTPEMNFSGALPFSVYDANLYQPETDLGRAYEMMGDFDKAIGVLERRARFNAASKDFRLTPPKVYYDLGRLYEKKGVKEKARANYRKFLELWKDADLGRPEVDDARRRLAGLKGS